MAGGMIDDDPLLTIDDFIRAGACIDGAYTTLIRIAKRAPIPSAMRASEIRILIKGDEQRHLNQVTHSYGYGDGYGDGNGNGNGW